VTSVEKAMSRELGMEHRGLRALPVGEHVDLVTALQ
jgi:hypothetical protein